MHKKSVLPNQLISFINKLLYKFIKKRNRKLDQNTTLFYYNSFKGVNTNIEHYKNYFQNFFDSLDKQDHQKAFDNYKINIL